MKWVNKKVGDLCKVGRGSSPRPIKDPRYFEDGHIPWIKVADATASGKYLHETRQHVNEFGASFSRLLPINSLIVCTSGTLGHPVFLGVEGCIHDGWLYTYDYRGLDPHFFYYFLKVRRDYFLSVAYGVAIQNINTEILRNTPILLPPLSEQKRIASILSTYDDLIENNRRRIQLLEQAARLLYKEWFTHLRFPGHQHTVITNGVPEGWSKRTVGEKVAIVRGKSYKGGELTETGGKPFVNLKCIARHGGFRLDGLKFFSGKHRGDQVVRSGDIVMAVTDMTQNRHIVAHAARIPRAVSEQSVFSMDTVKIIPNATVDKRWFYFFLRYSGFSNEVREHATGTNVLHLKPKQIEDYEFNCPTYSLQSQFGESAQSILDQQDNLTIQNQKLAAARDLLLPRMMNGEISI